MDAFFFGLPSRRLFASFHEGTSTGPAAGLGVLLCPPWGQEAIRTQRMFRVLAERLARAGASVLRFDYFGTGDSAGDDMDVTAKGCCQDILSAHQRLQEDRRVQRIAWVGVRLGGSFAAMALWSSAIERPPQHLIMWEPVVNGQNYLKSLRHKHVEALQGSYTRTDPSWGHSLVNDPEAFTDEAIGFAMSDALRDQVAALKVDALCPSPLARVTTLAPHGCPEYTALASALSRCARKSDAIAFEHDFDWTSEEALNTALVPGSAVRKLFDLCLDT